MHVEPRRSVRWAALAMTLLAAAPAAAQTAPEPPAAQPSDPATPVTPPRPLAETLTGEAKESYELGRLLFGKGDYQSAMVKFLRAHELSGDARLLWNVAVCENKLNRYARVIAVLERYRKEGAGTLTPQDLRDAEALERSCRPLVSELRPVVGEPGVEVFVDEVPVGTTPFPQPVLVDAGQRRLRFSKRGFRDQVRIESVSGGGAISPTILMEREAREGRLIVSSKPDAQILLDGQRVGLGRWEGTVASGGHTLRVTAPGMTPYQTEVVVSDNQVRRVQVDLRVQVKSGGIPMWVWIAGGAALAAGAVTAGAVLLQPDPKPVLEGTLWPGAVQSSFRGRR